MFIFQGGIYVWQICDWYMTAFCFMLGAALEVIMVAWIYGIKTTCFNYYTDVHLYVLGYDKKSLITNENEFPDQIPSLFLW